MSMTMSRAGLFMGAGAEPWKHRPRTLGGGQGGWSPSPARGRRSLLPPSEGCPAESHVDRRVAVPKRGPKPPHACLTGSCLAELGDLPGVGLAVEGAGSQSEHVDSGWTGPGEAGGARSCLWVLNMCGSR